MTVPFDDDTWWHDTPSFPVEHFVYSSSSSSSLSPPSLISLPPCFYGGDIDPVLDKFFQQHRRQRQRIMFNAEMGIICHGGDHGEFTVAHLCHHQLELCLLHHLPSAGGPSMEWSLYKLQISPDMKIDLDSWRTDVVVPIGRSLCWVDYYQGMLLVDVLGDHRQVHGIRLPAQALNKCRHRYNDDGDPDPFRHVGVADNGIIKLVCVFVKGPPFDDDFNIITWTLVDIDKGTWRKDVDTIMGADEFFGLINSSAAQSRLPRVQPSFPVMSLVDPDVICFLLIKEEDCNRTWMVEVNMRSKVMLSSALYINEEEEEGHPSAKDCTKGFYGHYFITTKFSYLSKDAITSRHAAASHRKKAHRLLLRRRRRRRHGPSPPEAEGALLEASKRSRRSDEERFPISDAVPRHGPDEARCLTPTAAAHPRVDGASSGDDQRHLANPRPLRPQQQEAARRHRRGRQPPPRRSPRSEDCAGRHVRVSLRIADPPAVSRLYLHWHVKPQISIPFTEPAAIAAHRSSILFRMAVPFDDYRWWHFVYSASLSSSSTPSLISLPPCFYGGDIDPVLDKAVRQHRSQRQRIMFDEDMGILCHGHGDNGDFTVAHLPHEDRSRIVEDRCRHPHLGRSLCWVDYYNGMLLVDVLAVGAQSKPNPQHLHSIRLPAQALKSRRLYSDAGEPDPFRHVGITDNGIIKLVCVLANHPPSDDDFKIMTWTLVDINKGTWIKDVDTIMGADEFFGLYSSGAQSCLPRVKPTFPVMSLVDPDVICFLLIKEEDCNHTWMVEVNMRSKVLQSSALYINEEEQGHPSEKDSIRSFFGHYFIPTKFSSYLSKDASTR
ncbi:hypothetical protein HU200_013243 [Digitaria exilis]|uniref:DUF1618 domain-containing protein n=1 Tax=Digitaria exilis TaxID=1010633 RepID=A0A835FE90_9POAL|nr:hypothetical protein HU200_013243 [Digitaria exilis]